MGDILHSCFDGDRCLRLVLLDLMMSPNALPWPGADGVTVEDVLASYILAAEQRRVPGREELIRRQPELAVEIRTFFNHADSWALHASDQGAD